MPLNMSTFKIFVSAESMGPPKKGAAGLQPASPTPKQHLGKTNFIDMLISEILHDLCFSLNQLMSSTLEY
jgi:hypothetical protein